MADAGKKEKTRRRTRARELTLQTLYMTDQRSDMDVNDFAAYIADSDEEDEVRDYAVEIYRGIMGERDRLDETIQSIAANWEIRRMPVIDRNILRLATYEIMRRKDIPRKVAINEAIDLAKKYSTKDSGAFINGILDKVRTE